MNGSEATFVAAVVAAAASLTAVALTLFANHRSELRSAHRAALQSSMNQLGGMLYRLVAMTKRAANARDDDAYRRKLAQADAASQEVDRLTRDLRYSLWGIDEGFRTMRMVPNYLANLKDERDGARAARVVELATELRVALDKAIRRAYASGSAPGFLARWRVTKKYQSLRTYFASCKPGAQVPDVGDDDA